MLRRSFLVVICGFCMFAGASFAGEEVAQMGENTELQSGVAADSEPTAVVPSQCTKAGTDELNLGALNWAGEGPLDPGECDDCGGGCRYTCFTHSQCDAQCPNGIGSCTQAGTCLCACHCNYDGVCEVEEEDECPDCLGPN